MPTLSVRVNQITESPIRHVTAMAEGATGVTRLHAGEPDFNTPEPVITAAKEALDAGWTKYTNALGIVPLREALADYDAPKLGWRPNPKNEIMVTIGGTNGLFMSMISILNPGDEVLVPNPGWPPYTEMVRLLGAVPVLYSLDPSQGFQLDRQSVQAALSVRTRMILVNSPSNPTGTVLSGDDLRFLAGIAKERDLWVISDEVYERILFDGRTHESIAALEGMRERTVVVNSFSKTWAMTGWRLGHMTGPAAVMAAAAKLQGCVNSCASSFVQMAAVGALKMPAAEVDKMRQQYQERRDIFMDAVAKIPEVRCVPSDGTFFILMDVRELGRPDSEIAEHFFRVAGVTSVPGSGFGTQGSGFLRFSIVRSPEEIREGLGKIATAVREMSKRAAA